MDKTMIKNIEALTGRKFDEMLLEVQKMKADKHSELVKHIQSGYNLTYGYANYIAMKAKKSDAGSIDDKDSLLENQYKNKEKLIPLYELLLRETMKIGDDIVIDIKKSYVSLKRKKQFALIQPTTKTRIDLGFNMKKIPPSGILEIGGSFNSMCTHRIKIEEESDINSEVLSWIKKAYEKAS